MKIENAFSLFLVLMMILVFSCKGAPKPNEDDIPQDTVEEQETDPEVLDENQLVEEINIDDESPVTQESAEIAEEPIPEDETANAALPESGEAQAALDEQTALEEEAASVEPPPAVETPVVVQAPVEPQPSPPVETAQALPPPEPEAQVQAPAPAPRRQPPLPPPALLGPAEEKQPARESAPQRPQPARDTQERPPPARETAQERPPVQERPPARDNAQERPQPARESAQERPPAQERQGASSPQTRQDSEGSQQRRQDSGQPRYEPPFVSVLRDDSLPVRQGMASPPNEDIFFSRTVRVTVGQILEVPFRGTGWIYLGELASRRGIAYSSTRREPDGQSIIFNVEAAGTYVLKFYKRDNIRDYIINDYVQVIATDVPSEGAGWFNPPVDRGRVVAQPRWPSTLDEAAILRGGARPPAADSSAAQNGAAQAGGSPAQGSAYVEPAVGGAASANGAGNSQGAATAQGATAPAQGAATAQGASSSQGTAPAQRTPPAQGAAQAQQPAASAAPVQGAQPQLPNDGVSSLETDLPSTSGDVSQRQERLPPEDLLQKAKETFDAGEVQAAIALLDQYREHFPSGSDELYWLYGQFYEANTPYRNILLSLDFYRRLVREYPQSSRVNDARRRIAYLERFYINIQ